MTREEEIAGQLQLLEIHRRTLAHYLRQAATLEVFTPPHIAHGISQARAEIQRIKSVLRGWGVVNDHTDDEEKPAPSSPVEPHKKVADMPSAEQTKPWDSGPIDFLIGAPLEEEHRAVLSKLPHYRRLNPSPTDNNTYYATDLQTTFPDGTTGTYRVVLTLLGKGRVPTALVVQHAMSRWQPRYVIVVGIAGGVAANGVNLGDLLVADQIVDYEEQKIEPQRIDVRYKVYPIHSFLVNYVRTFHDDSWVQHMTTERFEGERPQRHVGPVASGDKVIAYDEVLAKHRDVWSQLIGTEMEAGGAAAAAFQNAESARFFMVRGVSDLADEDKNATDVKRWRPYACEVAAAYTIGLLQSGPVWLSEQAVNSPTAESSASEPGRAPGSAAMSVNEELTPDDLDELASILVKSTYAEHSRRKALCFRIRVDASDLPFIDQGAPADFARELIDYLYRRDNITALLRLCDELNNSFQGQGRLAAKLATIRPKIAKLQ